MFDCYCFCDVQWKFWEIFFKFGYVVDFCKGFIYNCGGVVDFIIVDSIGQELLMGIDFDFFGFKVNYIYIEFLKEVLVNW